MITRNHESVVGPLDVSQARDPVPKTRHKICTVVGIDDGSGSAPRRSAIDAERMLSIVGNDELAPIAVKVRTKLSAVVARASNS
jgi:hypothetical protein